jgi:SulP family sulfate permease
LPLNGAHYFIQPGFIVMVKATLNALVERLSLTEQDANLSLTNPNRLKTEVLAGLTVALALVPEAVAFAFVAGVHPLVGLYAAFIVGW